MRTIFLGVLAVLLAGCGTVGTPAAAPSDASLPSQAAATTRASSPSSTASLPRRLAPASSPSLLQMSEAFLVVWSRYHHVVDQVNGRHPRKTGPDYQSWCQETDAADLGYIDGISSIDFAPAQARAAEDLLARAREYDAALKACAGHTSIRRILKVEASLVTAGRSQADAEMVLRTALSLPTGG